MMMTKGVPEDIENHQTRVSQYMKKDDKDDHNYYDNDEDKPNKGVPVDEEDNGGGKEAGCVLGGQVVRHLF